MSNKRNRSNALSASIQDQIAAAVSADRDDDQTDATAETVTADVATESETDRMIRMLTEAQTLHAAQIDNGLHLPGMIDYSLSDSGDSIVETVNPFYTDFGCPEFASGSGKSYPNPRIAGASSMELGVAVFTLPSGCKIPWAIRSEINPQVENGEPTVGVSVPKSLVIGQSEELDAFKNAVLDGFAIWMQRNNIDPLAVAARTKAAPAGRRKLADIRLKRPDGTTAATVQGVKTA